MKITTLLPLLLMGAALAGCATSGSGPVDVTRFHRADQAEGAHVPNAASSAQRLKLRGAERSDNPTESPSGCACDAALSGWQLCRVRQQLLVL